MDTRFKLMIIEDDASLAREICLSLKKLHYDAVSTEQFENILEEFIALRPQLVLMDINLPYHDGFYWCNQLRQISKVPIIYISSRDNDRDKITAIAQGGDDYVEKPFRMELLNAKIEAILRRTYEYQVKDRIFLNTQLCFDSDTQSLYFAGEEIDLTKSERRLFARLVECKPDIVTREELMMTLWNTDEYVTDAALTTIISRLRGKLNAICGEDVIQTKKGQGYFIK
ncbi:MAG: response regulator transcription factor [Lachnospiraceae bacterium]|nr:response regulator transcription factor [Lachnospiraceae bacterium]